MLRDDSTQTDLSLNQSTSSITVNVVPALTILWHPDPTRVGSLFCFSDSGKDEVVSLSRNNPVFSFYCDKAAPLDDAFLSRQPILELAVRGRNLVLTPSPGARLSLDGKLLEARAILSPADVARAPILTIGRRIALCLHFTRQPSFPCPPNLGLLGNSDAMATVRQSILAVAPLSLPVLIRGETGTGKELTAKAIFSNGPRASKGFLDINIGSLPENLAAAELFGHERGAFTGATQARDGLFHQADTGTLFLDEIGLARSDVQTALLRVLETGEVRRLGGTTSRRVDVRLLAATDSATIDRAVEGQGFSQALFHRLSASSIHLPPLRSRREDLGVLLLHFLKEALAPTGDVQRLETPPDAKRPWLSAEVMPLLASSAWPGNVRQLGNFAREIAIANHGLPLARVSGDLLESLRLGPPAQASQPTMPAAKRLSQTQVREALERNGFERSKAARELGVARTTIYDHMRRDPDLRLLETLSDEDLQRRFDDCKGDLQLLAKRLRVSCRALQLRLKKR